MSTESIIHGFPHGLPRVLELQSGDEWPTFDQVMSIASERLDAASRPPTIDPCADHLTPEIAARRADVDDKHRRIIAFLQSRHYEAALLTRADSIAWLTAGADVRCDLASETATVALFVSETTRSVLADNVQSARIFEQELAGLGFQLKERPWMTDPGRVITELTRNKRVAGDALRPDLAFEFEELQKLRRPMTTLERSNLRSLGRAMTGALEATCHGFVPGVTEADVAGQLAHRLLREGIVPVELRVAGDGRHSRYRRSNFKSAEIHHRATISVTGRRLGLCASASRSVCFGPIDDDLRDAQTLAAMVAATSIYFSRPGELVSEVYRRSRRIYEKFGRPDEWTLDYQGEVIGYSPREIVFLPDSRMHLPEGAALRWSPSVDDARSEDTVMIDSRGFELVTRSGEDWPKLEVAVKGFAIELPAVLGR